VVDEGSATLYKPDEFVIGLDANHLTMCKFADRNNLYSTVLRRLSAEIAAIAEHSAKRIACHTTLLFDASYLDRELDVPYRHNRASQAIQALPSYALIPCNY
jgi:hypothetical protein